MEESSKNNYKNRKYTVKSYNPEWKKTFEEERKLLNKIFNNKSISIEHIGSTSIPGLAGKPTIDILVTVENVKIVDKLQEAIENIGYRYLGEYVIEGSRLFVKEENDSRLVNLHIFEVNHPHVAEMINLKKYLLSHPEVVREYSELKFDLFKKYPNDYKSYRKYKDKWMEKLKKKILKSIKPYEKRK